MGHDRAQKRLALDGVIVSRRHTLKPDFSAEYMYGAVLTDEQ
jgi:hypothetical protein